jgi:hypothetical protein
MRPEETSSIIVPAVAATATNISLENTKSACLLSRASAKSLKSD